MLFQCWPTVSDAGPASNQHWFNASCLLGCVQPSKHKTFVYHLYNVGPTSNRLVQMLYRCFVFAGNSIWSCIAYCWRRLQADTDPMSIKCWASVAGAGQYPFSPSTSCCRYLNAGGTGMMLWTKAGLMLTPQSVMLAHIQRGAKHDTVIQ